MRSNIQTFCSKTSQRKKSGEVSSCISSNFQQQNFQKLKLTIFITMLLMAMKKNGSFNWIFESCIFFVSNNLIYVCLYRRKHQWTYRFFKYTLNRVANTKTIRSNNIPWQQPELCHKDISCNKYNCFYTAFYLEDKPRLSFINCA